MRKPVAASSPAPTKRSHAIAVLLSLPLSLAGCGSVQQIRNLVAGPPSPYLSGYIGNVVADEPVAALAGRDVLARGGNAADAAAAVGMTLAVTLPSRASLGGGGACLAYRAGDRQGPTAFLFTPIAGSDPTGPGGRPASVPLTARGLFLMQTRYGSVTFDDLVKPAARLARSGTIVSRALADDLAVVSGPLLADQAAAAIFARPGTAEPVQAGDQLLQPDLANTLDRIALSGVGDLHTGLLWRAFADGAAQAHAGLSASDIRDALPGEGAPLRIAAGNDSVAFLPPPADGGLGALAAFRAIQGGGSGEGSAEAAVASWRAAHPAGTTNADLADQVSTTTEIGGGAGLGQLPASTAFTVIDRKGGAVACALTMDNLFGTGRIAGTTGIVLGASPARLPTPLLAAAIAWSPAAGTLRAALAGSGQNQAALAVAQATANVLAGRPATPVTETGRVNAIACPRGQDRCIATADPRGDGLATRSD